MIRTSPRRSPGRGPGRGRGGVPGAVLLGALLLAGPAAGLVGLPGDDAGSGRDAGDVAALAVPIAPGTHRGRLGPGDSFDHFRVQADQGDVLVVELLAGVPFHVGLVRPTDPIGVGGLVVASPAGRELRFPAYEAGGWVVQVHNLQTLAPGEYALRVGREPSAASGVLRFGAGWQAAELAWDQPADVVFFAGRGGAGGEVAGPRASLVHLALAGAGYGLVDANLQGSFDAGAGPAAVEARVRMDSDPQGAPYTGLAGHRDGYAGWMRFAAASDAASTMLSWAATRAPRAASASGQSLVEWREADDPGVLVHSRVLTVSFGAAHDLALTDRFLGAFQVGSAPAAFTDAAGQRQDLAPGATLVMDARPPGSLRFEVAPHVHADGQRARLVGAFLPAFGIAPP